MLQLFRKNTKIFAWFFVIVLMLGFGLTSFRYNKHEQYAGEVFGKHVSFQEFRAFETLTRLMPASKDLESNAELFEQTAWQHLILSREAKAKKIDVSDAEVRAEIDQLINGESGQRISQEGYERLLHQWHTTSHEFETGIREMLRVQKMVANQFRPKVENASKQTGKDATPAQKAADTAKVQKEYVTWLGEIFARARLVDYSKKNNTPPAS